MVSNTFSSVGRTVLRRETSHKIVDMCHGAFQENTGFAKKYQKEIHCNCVFTGHTHQVFSLKKLFLVLEELVGEKKCTNFIWNHPMQYLISMVTKRKVVKHIKYSSQ